MHKASIVAAAFLMTLLSVCANLPATTTQEAIAPVAQQVTAAAPAQTPANTAATTANSAEGATGTPASGPAKKPFDEKFMLIVVIGLFVLFYVWMGRGRKKEQKKRAEMLANMKKGDKVTTIGGVTGTVTEVSADEVVVKVDEASNTKIRFARWAIRGVGEESKAENPSQK